MAKLTNGRVPALGSVAPDALLPVRPNVPFLLFHTPKNWFVGEVEVQNGKKTSRQLYWLPKLKPLPLQPGTNNVKAGPDGEGPDYMAAQKRIERRLHGTLLSRPHQIQQYLREHDCRDQRTKRRGLYYTTAWETPEAIDGTVVTQHDDLGYHRWLLSLVEDGTIRPPHPTVIEQLRSRRRGRIPRQGNHAHIPGMAAKLAATQERVDREAAALIPEAAP